MKAAHWQDREYKQAKHQIKESLEASIFPSKTPTQNEPSTGSDLPIISQTHASTHIPVILSLWGFFVDIMYYKALYPKRRLNN